MFDAEIMCPCCYENFKIRNRFSQFDHITGKYKDITFCPCCGEKVDIPSEHIYEVFKRIRKGITQ